MRIFAFMLTAALLSGSLAARADSFALTGSGVNDTFVLPSSPTTSASGLYGFDIASILVDENGVAAINQISFFSAATGGGLILQDSAGEVVDGFGPQLYNGASDDPTFKLGTFLLSDLGDYTIKISNTAVTPEPSAILLLGTGLLGFARIMRRRLA